MPWTQPSRTYRLAFAALMASVAVVFWRQLFTADVLFLRDAAILHYPRALELRELVHSGQWPLWNPVEHFGEPVAANPIYLLFYPTTWLSWVLPPSYAFKLHYILHFFVLAAGSFLLARRLELRPFACYMAGALFVFSGPVMSMGSLFNIPASAWMPLVILAADSQMRRGGWRGAGLHAAALTLQLFGGGPLISLATMGLALGWSLALYGDFRERFWTGANRAIFTRFFAALALAAGLSAIQVVPALWHMRFTERAGQLPHSLFWSLHPVQALEMVFPEILGAPLSAAGNPWQLLEGREPYLFSVFIGIVPLAFGATALLAGSSTPHARVVRFWSLGAAAALLLALGRFTPFSEVFVHLVPVLRVVRFPVKLMVPVALAVAQLAALGFEYLAGEEKALGAERRFRWLGYGLSSAGAVFVLLAALFVLWPDAGRGLVGRVAAAEFGHDRALRLQESLHIDRPELVAHAADWMMRAVPAQLPYVLGSVLLLVAALNCLPDSRAALCRRSAMIAAVAACLQLISVHYELNPVADRRLMETEPPVLRYLEQRQPPQRVFAEPTGPVAVDLAQVESLPPPAHAIYAYRLGVQVGAGAVGIENPYSTDIERLLQRPQQQVHDLVNEHRLSGEPLLRLLRLGSIEYALLTKLPALPGLEQTGEASNATTTPVRVFRVLRTLPRAYLVREAVVLPPGDATIQRLLSAEFDPAHQVVIEQSGALLSWGAAPPGGPETATLLRRDAMRAEVSVSASAPAYLVLTDSYSPDWQVSVNGNPARMLRANQMFRAVALPAGEHHVVFRYWPVAFFVGAAISAAALLAVVFIGWRRRTKQA